MNRSKRIYTLLAVLLAVCLATLAISFYEKKQEEITVSNATILSIPKEDVQAVSWEAGESFSFTKTEAGWQYEADTAFPVSEEKIERILKHFESFVAAFAIENAEDRAQYGLDSPAAVVCLRTEEQEYTIRLGSYSTMDSQRYVDVGDGCVYLVEDDPEDFLPTKLSQLILHDEAPSMPVVNSISFAGAAEYSLCYEPENEYTYSREDVYFTEQNGQQLPLDTDAVEEYIRTIEYLDLSDYATYNATEEELAAFGLDTPELTVTVEYQDEEDQEQSCTLHLGQNREEAEAAQKAEEQEKETIPAVSKYLRMGDSQIVYEISDTEYETLSEAAYDDLRHKQVFWASFEDVTQIDITLEDEQHTLYAGDDDTWLYKEESVEITELQNALTALSAKTFTREAASQKEEIGLTLRLDQEKFPEVEIRLYRYDGIQCLACVDGEPVSLVQRSAVMKLVEAVQSMVLN